MVDGYLLPALAFGTMALVIVFAVISKRRTEQRKHDAQAEKSSLAKDGPGKQPFR